jgi:hypothetical protein
LVESRKNNKEECSIMATNDMTAGVLQAKADTQLDVDARLAEISKLVAAKTQGGTQGTLEEGYMPACPIDPAERALCDSCQ